MEIDNFFKAADGQFNSAPFLLITATNPWKNNSFLIRQELVEMIRGHSYCKKNLI